MPITNDINTFVARAKKFDPVAHITESFDDHVSSMDLSKFSTHLETVGYDGSIESLCVAVRKAVNEMDMTAGSNSGGAEEYATDLECKIEEMKNDHLDDLDLVRQEFHDEIAYLKQRIDELEHREGLGGGD